MGKRNKLSPEKQSQLEKEIAEETRQWGFGNLTDRAYQINITQIYQKYRREEN